MHTIPLFLLTLASFLRPLAAGPLAIRDTQSSRNQPICTGDSSPGGAGVSMQTYCVDTLGATCATVVVFPSSTQSGNPGNCGNACSCTASQCPAVPFTCADSACQGDPTFGCAAGTNDGCPCTGPPITQVLSGNAHCPKVYICGDDSCQGAPISFGEPSVCSQPATKDCVCSGD